MINILTKRQKVYQVGVVIFCILITFLNYLDRSVLSYAIMPLESYFHIDNTKIGLAVSLFALGTFCINWFAGILCDRYPPMLVWPLAIVWWSAFMFFQGIAGFFGLFLLLRFFLGLGEGVSFPAETRTLSDWINPKFFGTVMAFSLMGVPLANLVGSPVLSRLIVDFGWMDTFIILTEIKNPIFGLQPNLASNGEVLVNCG